MKKTFTPGETQKLVPYYFSILVGKIKFIDPYPTLEVGFVKPEKQDDGNYQIFVGVYPFQIEFPEFMGFSECKYPLVEFLHKKEMSLNYDLTY